MVLQDKPICFEPSGDLLREIWLLCNFHWCTMRLKSTLYHGSYQQAIQFLYDLKWILWLWHFPSNTGNEYLSSNTNMSCKTNISTVHTLTTIKWHLPKYYQNTDKRNEMTTTTEISWIRRRFGVTITVHVKLKPQCFNTMPLTNQFYSQIKFRTIQINGSSTLLSPETLTYGASVEQRRHYYQPDPMRVCVFVWIICFIVLAVM